MNYLHRKSIHFFSQISTLSLVFLIAFNIPVFAQSGEVSQSKENKYVYQNTSARNLSIVGVAITTNLGTKHTHITSLPATIYKDVLSIEEVLANSQQARDDIISKNMLLIQEYRNISATNIQSLLSQSYDKQGTLKTYLDTLKQRYSLANKQINSLAGQKQIFESTMTQTNAQIEDLKIKISNDFSAVNTDATLENVDKYIKLKNKYYTARTYVIFINKFITQYQYLNTYNSSIAEVLINNTDAIIKDSYIVLPSSGDTRLLQDLDLIFEDGTVQ